MAKCDEENINDILSFVFQPDCECGQEDCDCDEDIIAMDCNDYCEQLATLAEQVAAGEQLDELMPRFQEHMRYWSDCRQEFEALVAITKAESNGELTNAIEQIMQELDKQNADQSPKQDQ
jgi:hypothetical protein